MSRSAFVITSLLVILVLFAAGVARVTEHYLHLPERLSQHETILLGQNTFVPGSQAAIRVLVRDSSDSMPVMGAQVSVTLQPAAGGKALTLYTGETDAQGTADITFNLPEDSDVEQILKVETISPLGSDVIERQVSLRRDYRLLLTTDKPVYQPGQVMHVRLLALSAFDMIPAVGQEVEVIIADGKGNKVFRQRLTTSDFGAAWTDFQLASEVNTGAYKISAVMTNTGGSNSGASQSEKTVMVEHYVLPKFKVEIETERSYYLPGQHVAGSLNANYFFGKSVSGGQVIIEGFTFDVKKNQVFSIQGETDEQGGYDFEFDLPEFIAGTELEGGAGRFYVQVTVTDQALHSESADLSIPVARNALVIEAVPEGGRWLPGVENIVYILTSYPDGAPADASISMITPDDGQMYRAQTGLYGLAEVRFTPVNPWQGISIEARDNQGNLAQRDFYFEGEYGGETVLLRPDRPVYRVGDTMDLAILANTSQGMAYLDIVRQGQTLSTRSIRVEGGKANLAVDVSPDMAGTLTLHLYKVLSSGSITRDTRLVVVDQSEQLNLAMLAGSGGDQSSFLPGDTAGLNIQVSGQDGTGVMAGLGIAVVDEAVFALAEQDPGFARLYFLLEQELMQPRYDLHGYSLPDLVERGVPSDDPLLKAAVDRAAQASLAVAGLTQPAFAMVIDTHQEAVQNALQVQSRYFDGLGKALVGFTLLLPLAVLGISLFATWRERKLGISLGISLMVIAFSVVALMVWAVGLQLQYGGTWADLGWALTNRLGGMGQIWIPILALLAVAVFGALAVIAWRERERSLGWMLALLALTFAVPIFLSYLTRQVGISLDPEYYLLGMLGFQLLPLSFLLRASAHFVLGRLPAALAGLTLFVLLVGFSLPLLGSMSMSPMVGGAQFKMMDGGGMVVEEAIPMALPAAMMPMPTASPAPQLDEAGAARQSTSNQPEPPRLRQYFPETMLWLPDAVTDANGALHLDIPVADSITTWRVTALASSQDGRLGSGTMGLRVFQDFFVDLDLPLALTVGDEVSVPVGIFNYMTEPQTVRLELEQSDWFELLDEPVKEIDIQAEEISVVYFRIRATRFGHQPFKVTAWGTKMSDAIQKEVRVFPNGKQISFSYSDRLNSASPVRQVISIPAEVIPGTQTLLVKIYPGVVSQVVEGLDSILRMPNGCFEQTSSTTYPNILVLDYLNTTNQASPEAQLKAEEYINLGYQRLTTFEVQSSGGFSLFGDAPADRMLTGYGLQEFADMSRVHDVDPALLQRAADWLLSQQNPDGSWENDRGLVHENTWSSLGDDRLPVTAYIAWSLVEAGYAAQEGTQKAMAYVRENTSKATDAYVLALAANALAADQAAVTGSSTAALEKVLDSLAGMAVMDGDGVYWKSGVATFMGSEGQTGSVETTALAALAFQRAESHPEMANAALTYLIRQKDNFGTWYSTQATVLTLKAMIQSVRSGQEKVNANVTITLNGGQTRTVDITPENFDVVQLVGFDDVRPAGENIVEITAQGKGDLMYQVAGSYYLPWDTLALYPELVEAGELVQIEVTYDRTSLAVNETVGVNVNINLLEGQAESALIDLGIPPGFSVQVEDLSALVELFNDTPADYPYPKVERYELTGRQILVYVTNLSAGNPLQFTYNLRAKFPLAAQAPASNAYDYYNPEVAGEQAPQMLVVTP